MELKGQPPPARNSTCFINGICWTSSSSQFRNYLFLLHADWRYTNCSHLQSEEDTLIHIMCLNSLNQATNTHHKYQMRVNSEIVQHFHATWHPKPQLSAALPWAMWNAPCRICSAVASCPTATRLQSEVPWSQQENSNWLHRSWPPLQTRTSFTTDFLSSLERGTDLHDVSLHGHHRPEKSKPTHGSVCMKQAVALKKTK